MFKKRTQKTPAGRSRVPVERTSSNKVFSYHSVKRPEEMKGGENITARHARDEGVSKKRRNLTLRRISLLVGVLLLLIILVQNTRLHSANVQVILRGKPEQRLLLQSPTIYQNAFTDLMQQKIANQNKLTVNTEALSAAMVKKFPEISRVDMSLPLFGGNSSIYIEPSSAALLFIAQDGKSYIIDNSGRVVSANTNNAPTNLPKVADQSGISPGMGVQVLPGGDVQAIYAIILQLKGKGLEIESMTLPAAAQRFEVKLQGRPYHIKFTLHDNVLQQVGAYIAVHQKLEREGTIPKEYVDVRVADRVYYR